jgi:hypothetical protein
LSFQNHKAIRAKTVLNFKIELPDGLNPIIAEAKVVWTKHPQSSGSKSIGVKFLKMLHTDRQRYVKYVCLNILDLFLDDNGELKT